MEFANLLMEVEGGIATITINRPDRLNALNSETVGELACALQGVHRDPAVRVVVLTGAGEKAFVAGADIKEMLRLNPFEAHSFAVQGQQVMQALERLPKPVIAALNGFALGGGLELALACDFIYAADSARIGFPEVGLGIIPGFGGTQNLPRLIGANRAHELIYSGRIISAAKALAWGIVNEVFPASELLPRTLETAAEIAGQAPLAVRQAKDVMARGVQMAKEDALRYEASMFGILFATRDRNQGLDSFVAKRKAAFTGE